MKNNKLISYSFIALFAFVAGFSVNCAAHSEGVTSSGIKIAVVDVAKILKDSPQIIALNKQQDIKEAEMKKWLEDAKKEINKQTTNETKISLAKKYDAELLKKQQVNRAEYVKKLEAFDNLIMKAVGDAAKSQGFDLILSKSAVLYGGNDITAQVAGVVK